MADLPASVAELSVHAMCGRAPGSSPSKYVLLVVVLLLVVLILLVRVSRYRRDGSVVLTLSNSNDQGEHRSLSSV